MLVAGMSSFPEIRGRKRSSSVEEFEDYHSIDALLFNKRMRHSPESSPNSMFEPSFRHPVNQQPFSSHNDSNVEIYFTNKHEHASDFHEILEDSFSNMSTSSHYSAKDSVKSIKSKNRTIQDFFRIAPTKSATSFVVNAYNNNQNPNNPNIELNAKQSNEAVEMEMGEEPMANDAQCCACRVCIVPSTVSVESGTVESVSDITNSTQHSSSSGSSQIGNPNNIKFSSSSASYLIKCNFCDKMFCSSRCTRQCELCFDTFCVFCTTTNYKMEFEKTVCFECNDMFCS
jgi:hypothetical protein